MLRKRLERRNDLRLERCHLCPNLAGEVFVSDHTVILTSF
jgi:hypothetical protein